MAEFLKELHKLKKSAQGKKQNDPIEEPKFARYNSISKAVPLFGTSSPRTPPRKEHPSQAETA